MGGGTSGVISQRSEENERALIEERTALVRWLEDLERRLAHSEPVRQRARRLRRLIAKLDSRIRLIRELGAARASLGPASVPRPDSIL